MVSPYLISLYREYLITFGCPHVHDIILFGWPDDTSPQGFVPPPVCTNWGEGLVQIRVTDSPIFSTLNGQTDNIFHGKPVINPYWLSLEHNNGITQKLYFFNN